jgi:uncharacterized membrane protein (UPF0127 family)
MARRFFLAALAAALLFVGAAPGRADLVSFDKGAITVDTAQGGKKLTFTVEIARNEAQREQGLMFRPSMAPDAGMLFLFDGPEMARFWMKNTLIPLDMLFVAADGHITNIFKRAVPMSESVIASAGPVVAVVELNGGTADHLGIKPGDLVHAPGVNE